jgi:hypothetical protein
MPTFRLGVKAEIERIFSICPKLLLINAKFCGLVMGPRLKNGYHIEFEKANFEQPLGANCSSIY